MTVDLLHDLGQIVVVNNGLRRRSLLAKAARNISQGHLVRIVLRRRPARPERRQENHQKKHPNSVGPKHDVNGPVLEDHDPRREFLQQLYGAWDETGMIPANVGNSTKGGSVGRA